MNKTTRYTVDSADRPRQWQCWVGQDFDDRWGIFYTDGLVDGKMKDPTFKEAKEKNIGKANHMTCEMQANAMLEQETGKKERKNYFASIELARSNKKWLPMLCKSGKWSDFKDKDYVTYPLLGSPKLDGARCNMMMTEEGLITQTRTGKLWLNFEHLLSDVQYREFFNDYPNIILDGEVYNHDYCNNFEALMSVFKKQKPTTEQRAYSADVAQFHVYDIFDKKYPNMSAMGRQLVLKSIKAKYFPGSRYFVIEPSTIINSEAHFDEFHAEQLDLGYEGTIARLFQAPYKVDGRSRDLIKRKEQFDCEFKILDVIEGEGNNKGMAAAVLIDLSTMSGMVEQHLEDFGNIGEQDAGMAKGWNHERCTELLANKDQIIGKMATIEYFEITGHGNIRFPKFKTVRDYEG